MSEGGYTILHRKDERGVIVESGTFGPDDEVPEGFEAAEYTPIYGVREDDQEPVAESVLTPWENPVAKGTWVEQVGEAEKEAFESLVGEDVVPEDDDELDEGSPREAREQSENGELTGAEEEADESLADDEAETEDSEVPPQGGPGSGKDVWAAYAASKDVEVPEGASRDEIIAACKAAGVPVD